MGLTVIDKETGKEIPREKLSAKQRESVDKINQRASEDARNGYQCLRTKKTDKSEK